MDEAERMKLDARLEKTGIDRLLADQSSQFINTIGGPPEHRMYAGEWLSWAIKRRTNTERSLQEGKPSIRRNVLNKLYEMSGEGHAGAIVEWRNLAKELNLEQQTVVDALRYLQGERLVESTGAVTFGLTHAGIKEIESILEHPDRPTDRFPAIQVVNISGGQNVVSQAHTVRVHQINLAELPEPLLKTLANELTKVDGGKLSDESTSLLSQLESGTSAVKIASAAEDVISKGSGFKAVMKGFYEELGKKAAEKSSEAMEATGEWLINTARPH